MSPLASLSSVPDHATSFHSIFYLFFEDKQATTLFPLSLSLFPTHTHRTDTQTDTHLTLQSSTMFARKHAVEQQRSSVNKP